MMFRFPPPPPIAGVRPAALVHARPCRPAWTALFPSRAVCSTAVLLLAGPSSAPAQLVNPEVRISTYGSNIQNEPTVAALGPHAIAAWNNLIFVGAGLGWGYSIDGGLNWTDAHQLPIISGQQAGLQPTLCADDAGNFYAATLSGDCCGYAIGVYRGAFQGAGFAWVAGSLALPSSYDPTNYGPPFERPWLGCDPARGNLYLTYTNISAIPIGTSGYRHELTIYFTRSLDQGATWSTPMALSSTACNGSQPAVGPARFRWRWFPSDWSSL